ncbi:MAG: cation transporter [Clostridiales bacterium]|nr:cation transporter [Clostridiales bacterium]
MVSLLIRKLVPEVKKDAKQPQVRRKVGSICGGCGIFFNLLLFLGKLIMGLLTHSIAIVGDALNNLSDAGSSIITLIGFRLAGKAPDADHPFGHGRIEYISGLLVSLLICIMGFELGKSSIEGIIHPTAVDCTLPAIIILLASLVVKAYMMYYNFHWAKIIDSAAMKATAIDSRNDMISTSVVLLAVISTKFTSLPVDAYIGVALAVFILYSGINAAKDTIEPLLGTPPSKEFLDRISEIVLSHEAVSGIHDVVVHDYGPGRKMISLHAEVSAFQDMFYIHDCIDNIEMDLARELDCEAVIHMDPIDTKNKDLMRLQDETKEIAKSIDPRITIHDFRMVPGESHTNLIFDMVVPHDVSISEKELVHRVQQEVQKSHPHHYCVIKIDRSYV